MNYIRLLTVLNKDLDDANIAYSSVKFFRKNFVSVKIYFSIMLHYFNNEDLHIEKILEGIQSESASRPTIFKILNDAESKKFLIKKAYKNDKRKFKIEPTEIAITEFKKWAETFRGFE